MHIGLADLAEPTLLILGDPTSLNWLARCLEVRQAIDFAASPDVELVNVGLVISPADDGCLSRSESLFTWKVTPLEAKRFAEQLRELAVSEVPAHAYLDLKTNKAGVQIIASQGEYEGSAVLRS